jgi:hypothetical protein
MFLRRGSMQKSLKFQQKRPTVKNNQAASKIASRDQISKKSTVRAFGTKHTTKNLRHYAADFPIRSMQVPIRIDLKHFCFQTKPTPPLIPKPIRTSRHSHRNPHHGVEPRGMDEGGSTIQLFLLRAKCQRLRPDVDQVAAQNDVRHVRP